jgi:hypothetical protein
MAEILQITVANQTDVRCVLNSPKYFKLNPMGWIRCTYKTLSHDKNVWGKLLHGVDSSWNVMAHGEAREGKWRENCWMEWVASTLHNTSEHGLSSITIADANNSGASSRLNWRPWWFKWTRPFRRKTKSGFCACTITFQMHSTKTNSRPRYIIFQPVENVRKLRVCGFLNSWVGGPNDA